MTLQERLRGRIIGQVARVAGVAPSTVSRILTGRIKTAVTTATAKAINEALDDIDAEPDLKALQRGRPVGARDRQKRRAR
jgi:transcriptional regulator with XRE-family HTH domain